MKVLYDRSGRASLRLLYSCFVTYAEGTHIGWLRDEAVQDLSGNPIGRFKGGRLRDREGMIVATELGTSQDYGSATPGNTEISDSWSPVDCTTFFRKQGAPSNPDTTSSMGRAS